MWHPTQPEGPESANEFPRVYMNDPIAPKVLSQSLLKYLSPTGNRGARALVVVCIGTDRSTGDALGPLVGSALQDYCHEGFHVYGTLDNPVHATNLDERVPEILENHPDALIVAVDACLGKAESVGYISLKDGPLKPGTGVNKKLTTVGNIHLIGVVNVGGFMEYFVLQNTRLSLVMKMAKVVAAGLRETAITLADFHTRTSIPKRENYASFTGR